MAVRVRFPLRVLRKEFAFLSGLFFVFVLHRVTRSVGGGVAKLSALAAGALAQSSRGIRTVAALQKINKIIIICQMPTLLI